MTMDISTIEYILQDDSVDEVSGVPFSAVVFMLYYCLEPKNFLLDMSESFMKKYPLKQYHNGATSTYLSGSVAQGLYLNTRSLEQARDIDIVTISRKYPIKDTCHYEQFPAEEWLLRSRSEGEEKSLCISEPRLNMTATQSDDRYLNIKVLPDTPPGYVLLQKCRRQPLPVQTVDDLYVSSLKTTKARCQFWFDSQQEIHKRFRHIPFRDDKRSREDGTLLYDIEQHGPAATAHMGGMGMTGTDLPSEIDMVFAVPYPVKWPSVAKEWLTRKRPSGWPAHNLIQEIKEDGCTLIPKGSVGSPMEEYEWRVSFTGDLKLARSLSTVQREIMHILKALISEPQYNQEIREKGINLTTEFESYQFLNLMYLKIEQINLKKWMPEYIATMLFQLIDDYLKCFDNRFLSHYFIKSRNILEKFRSYTEEELDDVLYTLMRIRHDPLGQILQQQRFLRLSPKTHQVVYLPFVDEIKRSGLVSHKLFVSTLIRLSKAHVLEGFYNSAYVYAMEALEFYNRIAEDTLSDEEYMDLMFTIAYSCHRYGLYDQTLEYLEKLHHVMQGKTVHFVSEVFGKRTHAYILALYARTLVIYLKEGTQFVDKDEVTKKARDFYQEARSIDSSNTPMLLDMLNSFMHIGTTEEVDELGIAIAGCMFENLFKNYNHEGIQTDIDSPLTGIDSNTHDSYNKFSLIKEASRKNQFIIKEGIFEEEISRAIDDSLPKEMGASDNMDSSSSYQNDEVLSKQNNAGKEEEANVEVLYDRKQYLEKERDEADLDDIDMELLRDYYRMKAFQSLGLEEKGKHICSRLKNKIKDMQNKGISISYHMLQVAYDRYENKYHSQNYPNAKLFFDDMLSVHDQHVIYSTADKTILDQHLKGVFDLIESTVIFVPIDVAFLHLKIQYYKSTDDVKQVEKDLSQMEKIVNHLVPWTDTLIGQYLMACHLDWLGKPEKAQETITIAKDRYSTVKELLDPPNLKDKVTDWIDSMFTVVAAHEPYNKYLDDIFAV